MELKVLFFLVDLAVFFWICPAWANPEVAASDFHPLFQSAADELGVPIRLTEAIAQVESQAFPHALNIGGQAFSFDSKEEAIKAARQAFAEGKSFDSGIMQVNSQWIKRFDLSLETLFDPAANIYLGSWILGQETARLGDTWRAVAHYHSPETSRGQAYVEQVKAALKKVEDRKTVRARVSAPGSENLAASLAKEAALLPAVPFDWDEPKKKIVSDAGIAGASWAGSAFVREPVPQNRLAGHLVIYRGLAAKLEANLAASGERENPAHVSPAPSVREKEKAPVFVQRFNGAQTPTFARQAPR